MTTVLEQGGGLEKYLIETAQHLSLNNEVSVITFDAKFTYQLFKILSFYYFSSLNFTLKDIYKESTESVKSRLGKAKYINVKNFRELKEVLNNYEVIYSRNEILEAFIFKFFIGYKNIPPIIFGVHTPHFYPIAESFRSKLHNFIYLGRSYNFLCSGVSAFHVINNETFGIIKNQFPKNKKIYLISNPFDHNTFRNLQPERNFSFKNISKKINILWVSRLSEQKGVRDLVSIINNVNSTSYKDKVFWHIVGSGQSIYLDMITDLKNKNTNIEYYGFVANNNIPFMLQNINLFISTSKWEASPYNIIEAQSLGVPVFAYNIAGPKDIVIHNVTGILNENIEEYTKNILNFIDGKFNFENIADKIVKKYSPEVIYPELLNMFEECKLK